MKERLLLYWQIILRNMDLSIIIIQAILVLMVVIIYISDSNTVIEQPQDPQAKPLETILPNPNYDSVLRLFKAEQKLESDESARTLQEYNMFDYKIVKERETYMKQWDEQYKNAEALYNQGKLQESLDNLKQILLHWPGHIKAKELRKTIEEKLKPKETPTPIPTPGVPQPPPGEGMPGEMGLGAGAG